MPRTLGITCSSMPTLLGMAALELRAITGTEEISNLYAYTLTLSTPDSEAITEYAAANVDFKKLVGHELTVSIELDGKGSFIPGLLGGADIGIGKGKREISGIVTRARFVRVENRRGIYEAVIEPWLTLATRSSDYRIFQNMHAIEIVQAVLGGYKGGNKTAHKPGYIYPLEDRTHETYPVKDFVVQYGESDFDFVSRILEDWGVAYFFEHLDGKHRMVLVDAMGAYQPNRSEAYQSVNYYPPGHKIDEEYLSHVDFAETLETGQWVSGDFDFKQPKARLEQKQQLPRNTGHNKLEHYAWPNDSYDPHQKTNAEQGQMLTRIRMEQTGSLGQLGTLGGNLRGMQCGHTFTLQNYPQDKYNNKDYLIVSSHLNISDVGGASGESSYHCQCSLSVMPTRHIYRPARSTPLPKTTGPQTAIVTGPKGREIYTDQYGRVKVSFHWNRYCTKDENSSCWIRVNQPWAGTNFGGITLPRIGQEVIVDFENGDPDRPIVTGRVYNAMNMPPWDLPGNQTQSGFLTRSSEGAGAANANALRFEDKKGQEEVWLHAEKDQRIEVEHDESHWVGHDRSKTIDHDETNHIKNDRTETVDGHEKITVHKTRTEEVDGDETLTVHSNRTRQVDLNETVGIGKNQTVKIGMNLTETVSMAHLQTILLGKMVNVGAAYNINVGGLLATVVGAQRSDATALNHGVNVGKEYKLEAGDSIELVCGESSIKLTKDGTITVKGKVFQLDAPEKINVYSQDIDLN